MMWEYTVRVWKIGLFKATPFPHGSEEERTYLQEMGEHGWELVGVTHVALSAVSVYYWKRPKETA